MLLKSSIPITFSVSIFQLLDLQLNDSNFRRYVLVQFLILFQYINAPIKFKGLVCLELLDKGRVKTLL